MSIFLVTNPFTNCPKISEPQTVLLSLECTDTVAKYYGSHWTYRPDGIEKSEIPLTVLALSISKLMKNGLLPKLCLSSKKHRLLIQCFERKPEIISQQTQFINKPCLLLKTLSLSKNSFLLLINPVFPTSWKSLLFDKKKEEEKHIFLIKLCLLVFKLSFSKKKKKHPV